MSKRKLLLRGSFCGIALLGLSCTQTAPTNSVGTDTAAAPLIAYTGSPFAYTVNVTIATLTPTNTGGVIASCLSEPALPTGLLLDNSTCGISGTPTVVTASATYVITAKNAAGVEGKTQIIIDVNHAAPGFSYASALIATVDEKITTIVPVITGGDISGCSVTPGLPDGLVLSDDCRISGTPSEIKSKKTYTITASNNDGVTTATATIEITVNDKVPSFSYDNSVYVFVSGDEITDVEPNNDGGDITDCSVSPSLPDGLDLSDECVISGTPTAATAADDYTITGSNTGGDSSEVIVNIEVT